VPSSPNYKRNYKQEKRTSDARGEKPKRAANNRARLIAKKAGKKIAGKDVAHKDNNTKNNSKSNLKVQSKKGNRSFARTKTAGRKKTATKRKGK